MAKRNENIFFNSFEFQCGDLPQENIQDAIHYLFLKGFISLIKEEPSRIDLSGYQLVPFSEVMDKKVSL